MSSEEALNEWVGGFHAVLEALKGTPERVLEVCIARRANTRKVNEIKLLASSATIKVRWVTRRDLDQLAQGLSHQGVLMRLSSLPYGDIDELTHKEKKPKLLLCLDGVVDPRNLGALLRSSWAFEVGAVIIPKHRAAGLTATVIKVASGAAFKVPVCRVGNISRALEMLKSRGYWVFGACSSGEPVTADIAKSAPLVLAMGAEGKGLRPVVRKACDALVSIPISADAGSLNVSVAAGVILARLFEALSLSSDP
jgi:23S rRNA (guanosine2251-2'-O)-methyltransferase